LRIADWGDLKSGRRKAETKISDLCVLAVKTQAAAEVQRTQGLRPYSAQKVL